MAHGVVSPTDRHCVDPGTRELSQAIQRVWDVECLLADLVAAVLLETRAQIGREPRVISGYRSRRQQDDLRRRGRPAAPDHFSNHRIFPAGAVDVSLGALPTRPMKWTFGMSALSWGLRWGGGSPIDPETGLPTDWQHLDRGPRPAGTPSGP